MYSVVALMFETYEIKTIEIEGKPWFFLEDVLNALDKYDRDGAITEAREAFGFGCVTRVNVSDRDFDFISQPATSWLANRTLTERGLSFYKWIHNTALVKLANRKRVFNGMPIGYDFDQYRFPFH